MRSNLLLCSVNIMLLYILIRSLTKVQFREVYVHAAFEITDFCSVNLCFKVYYDYCKNNIEE